MTIIKASEQIFQQANANVNKQVFGSILVNVKAYGAKGDGVANDTVALQAAFDYGRKYNIPVYIPTGNYKISSTLNIGGVTIIGVESSIADIGKATVIYCATKTFTALKQMYQTGTDITFDISNIVIRGADVGLDIGTAVNCEFTSIYFYDCNLAIQNGHNAISGPLFNTWTNIYTDPTTTVHSMVIEGLIQNNNNVFINCAFYSQDWTLKINVNNGLGAINNYFLMCQIQSYTSYGVDLNGTHRNTKFENCYLESKSSAIVVNGAGSTLVINDCVYGNLVNTNTQGYNSFIYYNNTCTTRILGGWIYLPADTTTDNLCLINGSNASYLNSCTILKSPEVYGTPTNYKVSGQYVDSANLEFIAGSNPYHSITRQAITNGNFDIWQRGTSFLNTSGYIADRWITAITNTGTLPTSITQQKLTLSSGELDKSFFGYRLTTNGAGSGFGANDNYLISQRIENGTRYLCGLGKKITVSFWAKSDIVGKRIGFYFAQGYGSGGSPSGGEVLVGNTFSLTSSWQKFTATLTTNTLSGKTFGTNNDDTLNLNFAVMWGATWAPTRIGTSTAESFVGAGNIDITQVQICAGDQALPFGPKSYGEELAICQRFLQLRSTGTVDPLDLRPTMRITPTITGASSPFLYSADL